MKCGVSISFPSRVRAGMRQPRLDRFKIAHCRLRLLAQWRRQRGDPGEEVFALLLPAELDDLVVLGVEHRGQIARECSDRNRARSWCPCPRCAQPPEADDEAKQHRSHHRPQTFSDDNQPWRKPRDLAISGKLQRVAGDTVDPCVADFAGEHRQRSAMRLDRIRNLGQARGSNLGIGKLALSVE